MRNLVGKSGYGPECLKSDSIQNLIIVGEPDRRTPQEQTGSEPEGSTVGSTVGE